MGNYFKSIKKGFKLKYYINYILVFLLLAVTTAIYLSGGLRMSTATLLTQIGFSIILAVSLNVVVGFLGELSLGHAGFMCIGAYIGGIIAVNLGKVVPSKLAVLVVSMIVGGIIAAVFGFVIGLPSLRLKGDYLAIVTLAFGEIVRNIFKNQKAFGGAIGLDTSSIKYDTRNAPTLFIVTFVTVIIMLALIQNLVRSKHGRAITAIRDNEIAAKAMGINVTFYKLFAFMVSAFFAGAAGVIYAHYATPVNYGFFSYNYSIEILVMVVLGGMGNITGSIVAAAAVSCINFFLQKYLSGNLAALKFLIYALVLIVIVVFGNAPALNDFRERIKAFFASVRARIFGNKLYPSESAGDSAAWRRIPTKIQMNEILSTDLDPNPVEQGQDETPENPRKEKE